MPKHIKNSKLALIGLIILFAVSSLMAGGGKPKIEKASANLRPLSASEIMGILQSFPEMVPGFLKEDVFSKKDTLRLKRLFRFSELDNTLLKQIFSNARFYRGFDGKKPPHPYLMVVVENKRYSMPSNFNRLLLEHNLEVNDGNIIELAKAFVIIALEGKEITFLEGKRIKKRVGSAGIYNAFMKVKIGDEIQEWYFRTGYGGQFWEVAVGYPATKEFYHKYHPLPAEKKIEEGGWDNSPQIKIELGYGGVYLDLENNIYHYYLIVSKDGESTKDSLKFLITGFPPDAKNVYIRAKSQ